VALAEAEAVLADLDVREWGGYVRMETEAHRAVPVEMRRAFLEPNLSSQHQTMLSRPSRVLP
jgi:hypothetical protein